VSLKRAISLSAPSKIFLPHHGMLAHQAMLLLRYAPPSPSTAASLLPSIAGNSSGKFFILAAGHCFCSE
jgi:hypothetical protein